MNIPYAFKRCTKCGEWLVANNYNFRKKKDGKWGLYSQCKECANKSNKQYRKNNKDKIKAYNKNYAMNNKDIINNAKNRYRNKNKEKIRIYNKKRYEENKERIREQQKIYKQNNPEKLFNKINKRRQKEENQGRGITKEQYKECFEWFDWKCAYSGEKLQKNKSTYGRTLDHIVALDNGGLNEIWNLIPMRLGYNSSKNNRTDTLNWYMEQEYFDIERLDKIVEWQIYAYEKWGGEEFGELILITDLFEEGE